MMKWWNFGPGTWVVYTDEWPDIERLRATAGVEQRATYMNQRGQTFAHDFIVRNRGLKNSILIPGAVFTP